ncbi:cysteinyl-tRNA synthetase [Thermoflexales bacterium]|nr:cysteinyl-tRNA synthetase [Thermoflexales bacterium]
MELCLYNTLTRTKEVFRPIERGQVRLYTCGPTVYRFIHIGNLRSFMLADWVRRTLLYFGYEVKHAKNITDVGHMRQELLDRGEDKMIAAARKEGKTPLEIAAFYTQAFLADEAQVNILPAHIFPRATDHVPEMIDITHRLLEKQLAYEVEGTIYFDVSAFPHYGRLSHNELEGLLGGVRGEVATDKRAAEDFALWKVAEPGRVMKWDSPWGEGFPGWHIECSAMALKHLGEQIDIHTGGVDLIFPHHEDEIAQSEGYTGHPFVNYWVHGQHLLVDGLKMAKSTRNDYRLVDLMARGFDPIALRYLYATAHYRTRLNFTFDALRGAQRGLGRMRERLLEIDRASGARDEWAEAEHVSNFAVALADDVNLPAALAATWYMLRSNLSAASKKHLLLKFDAVLGFGLPAWLDAHRAVPEGIATRFSARNLIRKNGVYSSSDKLRASLEVEGFSVHDTPAGSRAHYRGTLDPITRPSVITNVREVKSLLHEPDAYEFSVNLLAWDNADEIERAVKSVVAHQGARALEIVLIDNGSSDGTAEVVERLAREYPDVHPLWIDHWVGEGAGRNAGLLRSRGRLVIILGNHIEVTGDIFTPIEQALSDPEVGLVGGWGVRSGDLRNFESSAGPEVDAVEAYLLAWRREEIDRVGWFDEKFRFYRHLDLEFSLRFSDRGMKNIVLPEIKARTLEHEHRLWYHTPPDERERKSKRNFYRFLHRWGDRRDLLLQPAAVHDHDET